MANHGTKTVLPIIACTLSSQDMGSRVAEWAAIGKRALITRAQHPLGVVLRYRWTPEIERELRRLIELETGCCEFLEFDLQSSESALQLTVSGPGEAAELIQKCWGA